MPAPLDQPARPPAQTLVAAAAPTTTARVAVSTGPAGTLLVTAGQNIERLRSDASFSALCGASPIPVSTGRSDRHRVNYGGDRDERHRAALAQAADRAATDPSIIRA